MGAPQQKRKRTLTFDEMVENSAGQRLPADVGMAASLAVFHRQAGVQQQDTLARPMVEQALGLRRAAKLARQLLEDCLLYTSPSPRD